MKLYQLITLFIITMVAIKMSGQNSERAFSGKAIFGLERLILSNDVTRIPSFIDEYVDNEEQKANNFEGQLTELIELMHELDQSVSIAPGEGEDVTLSMAGGGNGQSVRISFSEKTGKITKLVLLAPTKELVISSENIHTIFNQLENDEVSGIIYIKYKGEILIKRAFGMADRQGSRKNSLNTIFGTGSRPIDYTIAAILLLDQQGKLSVDDPISNFIEDVPSDKKEMTINHLMKGQSGLPDFFDNDSDWDADLAWVNRDAAIKRMMNQTLLFEPGKGTSHSHGAFGLLAAIVEIVSGSSYYNFIKEHFLDPAGMTRTGEYGESKGLSTEDFAVGWGPQRLGIPNIPPNWGPTSWLIKGSGGMYSTLEDLMKFYRFVREGNVLDEAHKQHFLSPSANLDGSMRGFELFSLYESEDSELFLFLNEFKSEEQIRPVMRALENMLIDF